MRRAGTALLLAALIGGCGSDDDSDSAATPSGSNTASPGQVTDEASYPEGFPKVVLVSSLPDQVRSWYEMDRFPKAIAVAPGVWTQLPPGASMEDALESGVLDGFCGSIEAYEREFTQGRNHAGTCW